MEIDKINEIKENVIGIVRETGFETGRVIFDVNCHRKTASMTIERAVRGTDDTIIVFRQIFR